MLVTRTIKDPPDEVCGFCGKNYTMLYKLVEYDYDELVYYIRKDLNVQFTSYVEQTQPDGLVLEEHDDTDTEHDRDTIDEGISAGYDEGELSSMEGEDSGDMEADMECTDRGSDVGTEQVAATRRHNDQEDTSERDDLDIQFIEVITT